MANFTTRVELHNHDDGDYEILHSEMRKKEFFQVIKIDTTWYDLPTAEYNRTSTLTIDQVFAAAKIAAQAVVDKKPLNDSKEKKDYWIIVTKADNGRRAKLKKATKVSKLPPGEEL